jgi:hypothetical protein
MAASLEELLRLAACASPEALEHQKHLEARLRQNGRLDAGDMATMLMHHQREIAGLQCVVRALVESFIARKHFFDEDLRSRLEAALAASQDHAPDPSRPSQCVSCGRAISRNESFVSGRGPVCEACFKG